jgi:hypothetical protein
MVTIATGARGPVGAHRGVYRVDVAPLSTEQIVALLVPVLLIQLGLMIAALYDLEKPERTVRGGSKVVWVLVIVFLNILGPILYFVAGREEA